MVFIHVHIKPLLQVLKEKKESMESCDTMVRRERSGGKREKVKKRMRLT